MTPRGSGEAIRRWRLDQGIRMRDLAAWLGISTVTLRKYERGARSLLVERAIFGPPIVEAVKK